MSRRRKYSVEQRLEAVKLVLENHMSCNQVAKNIGASASAVKTWVKRYKELGLKGLTMINGT